MPEGKHKRIIADPSGISGLSLIRVENTHEAGELMNVSVRPSATGMMVNSPFGAWVVSETDLSDIADALIRIAGMLRRSK